MSNKTNRDLAIIIALGLALRLIGTTNGFPFIFHPDEPTIIRSALGIRFFWNPGHFDWPHLYIYLNYFLYMLFAKIRDLIELAGYREYVQFDLPLIWNDDLIFYLITRIFTAVIGAFTAIPIYLAAKNVFSRKAGIYAALAITVTPFHVWYSHYALADVPMTFFVAWVVYFSSKILFKKDMANYLMAGLFLGLAATSKYNGALAVIAILLAHFMRVLYEKDEKVFSLSGLENLFFAGMASLFTFILGTPYALFDYKTFIRTDGPKGALWQFTNVGKVDFFTQVKNFFEIITFQLSENTGYVLVILFAGAFFYVIYRIFKGKKLFVQRDLAFFVLVTLVLVFYVSGAEKTRSHYFFMVYPSLILAGVGFLWTVLEKAKLKNKKIIWGLVMALPLYFSLVASYRFYLEDTRVLMYKWLQNHTQSTSSVYFEGSDLDPVRLSLNRPGGSYSENVSYSKGSLVVMTDEIYEKGNLLVSFDNKMRKGPVVNIYLVN